ncbi:LysR family transcriptional regulator [Ammoniphilus sp. YIM 78166]|uniref:LysR family transcriptional regulator n=1 Tax=Ammoniphilus sp. YIM 78166 TaxID=1644106 RepID=UPI00106F2E98|nr:LysR family transcriptional regulator [Ammoniphilus sp. YIM 78166]
MDLIHLETFICLVQQGTFSRTAKFMGVSQPTVTIRIKALEDDLGLALILRAGNKVGLTPVGQLYYDDIERSLRVLRNGLDTLAVSQGSSQKRLNVWATPTVGTYVAPYFLGQFCKLYQDWEISLNVGNTKDIAEMVLDEVAHIGFISSFFDHPDLFRMPMYHDQFYLVANPGHPLAQRTSIDIFELRTERLITYEKGCSMSYRIESLFREIGLQAEVAMELNHSDTIKRMVLAGHGLAFLPWISIEDEVHKKKLAILPLHMPKPLYRETSIIFKSKNKDWFPVSEFMSIFDKKFVEFTGLHNLPVSQTT